MAYHAEIEHVARQIIGMTYWQAIRYENGLLEFLIGEGAVGVRNGIVCAKPA